MIIFHDDFRRALPEAVKVGINFPVTPPALDKCLEINAALGTLVPGEIDFRPPGTSSPHVTVAMGILSTSRMDALIEALEERVSLLSGPIEMTFRRPYRETVTGRYVVADVSLSETVRKWRIEVKSQFAPMFDDAARTSDDPHLTLGIAESNADKVDQALIRAAWNIPSCTVDRLHVSLSGAKGVKSHIIAEVVIAGH